MLQATAKLPWEIFTPPSCRRLGMMRQSKLLHQMDVDYRSKSLPPKLYVEPKIPRMWSKVSGKEFACKILIKGEETVHKEVEIMQHLSGHPGVVTLKAVYEDAQKFYLVMELCSGGRSLDQMRKDGLFSEQKAANLIKDLMLVLKYHHEMGVIHRDVDKIYLSTPTKIAIMDHEKKQTFLIWKEGLPDAVVWNPWDNKAKAMADFGDDKY